MTGGARERNGSDGSLQPEEGQELASLLAQLGVDERPARVIGYLAIHGDGRSAEIEEALSLRQPEVSQATKQLRDMHWVVAEPEKTPGKGRPVNVYQLNIPLAEIVHEVAAQRREEINRELARLDRLQSLVEPPSTAARGSEPDVPEATEEPPEPRKS